VKGRARKPTRTEKPRRGRAKRAVPPAHSRHWPANPPARHRLYQVTPRHLQLLAELDRLFPDLAPIIDLRALRPGMESVETISATLLGTLIRRADRPVFLAFSEINSERILDHIQQQLDAGAWSLDAHDVFAEVLYRLFERLRKRDARGDLVKPADDDWRPFEAGRAVFDVLAQGAASVIREQVEWLTASTMPLPGLVGPRVQTPAKLLEQGRNWIAAESVLLGEKESERVIAHALLTLPDLQRRLIHLRDQRGLETQEIARLIELKPFEVLLQLKNAELALHDRIQEVLTRLRGGPLRITEDSEVAPPRAGKLLRLRTPVGRGERAGRDGSDSKRDESSASSVEAEEKDDE
jgi:DNA-directed RNA polymerase specialized sigma24 family protein